MEEVWRDSFEAIDRPEDLVKFPQGYYRSFYETVSTCLPKRRLLMRFLLKASIPVEAGNRAAKEGRLAKTIESILGGLKTGGGIFSR